IDIELFAEARERTHGVQEIALPLRQRFEPDPAAKIAQQGLEKRCSYIRRRCGVVDSGESEDETVCKVDQKLTAGGKVLGETEIARGRQRVQLRIAGPELAENGVVGAEPMEVEFESVEGEGQRDGVKVL